MGQVIDASALFQARRDRHELVYNLGRAVGTASIRAVEIAGELYRACMSLAFSGLLLAWWLL